MVKKDNELALSEDETIIRPPNVGVTGNAIFQDSPKFYERSPQDIRQLLDFCKSQSQDNERMAVRQTHHANPDEISDLLADMNSDVLGLQMDEGGAISFRDLQLANQAEFGTIQRLLDNVSLQGVVRSVSDARLRICQKLRLNLEDTTSIAYRHPITSSGKPGVVHLPHQVTELWFALDKEDSPVRGHGNGDQMGSGKTYMTISLIIAGAIKARNECIRSGKPSPGVNLVIVPSNLEKKWWEELFDKLGSGFLVKRLGSKRVNEAVQLRPTDPVFSMKRLESVVILGTYEWFSSKYTTQKDNLNAMNGKILRIFLDEAHNIRHFQKTKRGKAIALLNARYRHVYSASLIYNNIFDIEGYVHFFARDSFDVEVGADPKLTNYLQRVQEDQDQLNADHFETEYDGRHQLIEGAEEVRLGNRRYLTHWREKCACGQTGEALCGCWPSGLLINQRRPSITRAERKTLPTEDTDETMTAPAYKRRRKAVQKEDTSQPADVPPPPFANNPFAFYHPNSPNRFNILSPKAYYWYIKSHQPNSELVHQRTAMLLGEFMIIRNEQSLVEDDNGNMVTFGNNIAPLHVTTTDVQFSEGEQTLYDHLETKVSMAELKILVFMDQPNADKDKLARKYRRAFLLTSSIHMFALRAIGVDTLSVWRKKGYGLPHLMNKIRQSPITTLPVTIQDRTDPLDTESMLEAILFGSPKLRQLCRKIRELCYPTQGMGKKLIVWAQWPLTLYLIDVLLSFLGIATVVITADDNHDSRHDKIRGFDTIPVTANPPMIFLGTFQLTVAGHDMHHNCSNQVMFEPAYSGQVENQAIGRVHRIPQPEEQHIERLFLYNSFNETLEWAQQHKQWPLYNLYGAVKESMVTSDESENPAMEITRVAMGASYNRQPLRHTFRDNLIYGA